MKLSTLRDWCTIVHEGFCINGNVYMRGISHEIKYIKGISHDIMYNREMSHKVHVHHRNY